MESMDVPATMVLVPGLVPFGLDLDEFAPGNWEVFSISGINLIVHICIEPHVDNVETSGDGPLNPLQQIKDVRNSEMVYGSPREPPHNSDATRDPTLLRIRETEKGGTGEVSEMDVRKTPRNSEYVHPSSRECSREPPHNCDATNNLNPRFLEIREAEKGGAGAVSEMDERKDPFAVTHGNFEYVYASSGEHPHGSGASKDTLSAHAIKEKGCASPTSTNHYVQAAEDFLKELMKAGKGGSRIPADVIQFVLERLELNRLQQLMQVENYGAIGESQTNSGYTPPPEGNDCMVIDYHELEKIETPKKVDTFSEMITVLEAGSNQEERETGSFSNQGFSDDEFEGTDQVASIGDCNSSDILPFGCERTGCTVQDSTPVSLEEAENSALAHEVFAQDSTLLLVSLKDMEDNTLVNEVSVQDNSLVSLKGVVDSTLVNEVSAEDSTLVSLEEVEDSTFVNEVSRRDSTLVNDISAEVESAAYNLLELSRRSNFLDLKENSEGLPRSSSLDHWFNRSLELEKLSDIAESNCPSMHSRSKADYLQGSVLGGNLGTWTKVYKRSRKSKMKRNKFVKQDIGFTRMDDIDVLDRQPYDRKVLGRQPSQYKYKSVSQIYKLNQHTPYKGRQLVLDEGPSPCIQ